MPEGRTVDDVVLLKAWCLGDRGAGDALLARHYPSVVQFFHHRVSEAAQEDLIQETFLACTRSAVRFRKQAQFRTYLYGIAHNVLASYLRRQGRSRARLGSQAGPAETPAVSSGPSPIAAVARHEEQRLLLEALRRIPLPHQIVLELHYWEDLSVAEIGEVLGVPLGTAKTRLRDGRARLQDQLRDLVHTPKALQSTPDRFDA
jgi:RNA polymerase sigma-70 factor (ECF subfamily)